MNVNKGEIKGTDAWRYMYPSVADGKLYLFTYTRKEPEVGKFTLIESHLIDYPFNIFEKKLIYLYQENR